MLNYTKPQRESSGKVENHGSLNKHLDTMNEIEDDVYRVIDNNSDDKNEENRRSQSAFNEKKNNYSEIKPAFKYHTNTIIK